MLIFELIGSPLIPVLMKIDTWLPIFIGLSLYMPILICALCLPETLGVEQPPELKPTWAHPPGVRMSRSEQAPSEIEHQTGIFSWLRKSSAGCSKGWYTTSLVIQENASVSLLLLTFLLTVLGNEAHDTLLQFARRRFGWSWSEVSPLEPFNLCSSLVSTGQRYIDKKKLPLHAVETTD